jgi:hypothetical protein
MILIIIFAILRYILRDFFRLNDSNIKRILTIIVSESGVQKLEGIRNNVHEHTHTPISIEACKLV